MPNGKFIKRDEANHLINERTGVESTIKPIVEATPENGPNAAQIKKAKGLVRNPVEGYIFDLDLVKELIDRHTVTNNKYLVVMKGMDDPKSTVILGVTDTINTSPRRINISVLGDEPALLQHPRGTKLSGVTLRKNLNRNDDMEFTIEFDEE